MLCSNSQILGWIQSIASEILTRHPEDKADCVSIALGLVMLLIQVFRRLLESLFVSVFSGRIHVSHYAVGITFYILTGTSIAHPYLTRLNNKRKKNDSSFQKKNASMCTTCVPRHNPIVGLLSM